MGLKNLFTPKWKHKNNSVREKAVRKLKNTERLKMIAENDSWWKVRKAAYETLGDDEAGKAIEINNITFQRITEDEAKQELLKISRPELLFNIAQNADVNTIRSAAVQRIGDDQMLCEIFKTEYDKYICKAVAERISDKKLLKKFLNKTESWEKRKIIYEETGEEQKALGEIAKNKKYRDFEGSMEAIKNITDISVLADVADNAEDYQARDGAKRKLEQQDIFSVEQCNDEKQLREIAQNSENWEARKAAFDKLGNEQMALGELAKYGHFWKMKESLTKLSDQSVLKDVALHAKDTKARIFALEKIQDETFIYGLAKNDNSPEVRELSVAKLTDEKQLLEIAETEEYWKVGLTALQQLAKEHTTFLKAKSGLKEKLEAKFNTQKKAEEAAIQKQNEQEAYRDAMDDAYDRMSDWD
jgi:hypothetical protein